MENHFGNEKYHGRAGGWEADTPALSPLTPKEKLPETSKMVQVAWLGCAKLIPIANIHPLFCIHIC